jgi:hypothetical protein
MNPNWQIVKEQARVVYARAAQLAIFMSLCFYLLACVIAGRPVGLKSTIEFANYCFHWQPENTPVGRAAVRQE